MEQWFIDTWQHLMGGLDGMLEDARGNAKLLNQHTSEVSSLLDRATAERVAAEETLRAFAEQRTRLANTLNEVQRELAVGGVPLRGEIS